MTGLKPKTSTVATAAAGASARGLVPDLDSDGLPLPEDANSANRVGFVVVSLAVISAFATYLILTGLTPITPHSGVVTGVLLVNGAMIVAMLAVVAWQARALLRAWRGKVPGARLHVRIVALFSVIAALPAILLAIAATTTFSRSLDSWFSTRTRQIIQNSIEVAQTYLEEHSQVMRTEIVSMARDLDGAGEDVKQDARQFRSLLLVQAGLRNLPAAFIVDGSGKVRVSAVSDPNYLFSAPPPQVITRAASGQVVPMDSLSTNRLAAVTRLDSLPNSYLYVVRGVSPEVVGYVTRAQAGVAEYEQLRRRRGGLHAAHALMYSTISMTVLLAAIWVGMWFASRFVAPIRRLIFAATEVSKGNLAIALPIRKGEGDLRRLSQTFNTMTSELTTQRNALIMANEQLNERRAFIEAVLSGVSAGVIGLDREGTIRLANRSAERLLGRGDDGLVGHSLAEAVPELKHLMDGDSEASLLGRAQTQVSIAVGGEERMFAIRATREAAGSDGHGSVVTFDDVTELVSAQRTSAWAEMARRLAHEIKNPLTPIQLSAERIRRKYDKVITEDREVFDKCTETIIRQVGDVTRMVDEFSDFARMPKPEMAVMNLVEAVRDSVTLHQMGSTGIKFSLEAPGEPIMMLIDRRLITQAMTNLVKNGAESVQALIESKAEDGDYKGRVDTVVKREADRVSIEVIDNGTGLGKQNRARLLEPYVTTKAKGTGLGLAIVQKIIEQHGGVISLEDAPLTPSRTRGALVRVVLPVRKGELSALKQARAAAAE